MELFASSLTTKPALDYCRPPNSDSFMSITKDQDDSYTTWVIPKVKVDLPIPFATVLAHEVRNPLTNINLSIEMLGRVTSDSERKMYLDIIKRGSMRIDDLMNELLAYKPVENIQVENHSLHQLIDEVLEMAADRIHLKRITVRKNYAEADAELTVNMLKMKIALTNIIINAIDAMTISKGTLTLTTKGQDGRFMLEIGDNGCGISKENLNNIFKPYFTNKPGGLGLGLATTCDILRSSHVGVNVESEEDRGTTFTLLF